VTGSLPFDTASSFFGRGRGHQSEPTDERTAWPAFGRAILDDEALEARRHHLDAATRAVGKAAEVELDEPVNFKTLKRFSFVKVFPADSRKINNLVLAVDQEVGGSNPPSYTKYLSVQPGDEVTNFNHLVLGSKVICPQRQCWLAQFDIAPLSPSRTLCWTSSR
jgi:hypothetical protein